MNRDCEVMFLDEATADLMDIDDWKVNLFSLQLRMRENKQTKNKNQMIALQEDVHVRDNGWIALEKKVYIKSFLQRHDSVSVSNAK